MSGRFSGASMCIPLPAIGLALMAANEPVAMPKVPGNDNMLASTMDPTAIIMSDKSKSALWNSYAMFSLQHQLAFRRRPSAASQV